MSAIPHDFLQGAVSTFYWERNEAKFYKVYEKISQVPLCKKVHGELL